MNDPHQLAANMRTVRLSSIDRGNGAPPANAANERNMNGRGVPTLEPLGDAKVCVTVVARY
jgi:hypothetical protein